MSVRDSTAGRGASRLLPENASAFLRNRAIELLGVLLFALGPALIAASISYNPNDPSLNRATTTEATNLLGLPGAYAADLLLQSLGLATLVLAVIFMTWGYRILRDHTLERMWLRLTLLPIGLLCIAMAMETLPRPEGWPFPSNLGGFSGALLASALKGTFGLALWLLGLIGLVLGLCLLGFCLALTGRDWRALGRGATWLFPRRQADAKGKKSRPVPKSARKPEARASAGNKASEGAGGLSFPSFLTERPSMPRLPSLAGFWARFKPLTGSDGEDEEDAPPRSDRVEPRLDTGKRGDDGPRKPAARGSAAKGPTDIPSKPEEKKAPRQTAAQKQGSLKLGSPGDYAGPDLELLRTPPPEVVNAEHSNDALEKNARLLEGVLQDFGVKGEIVKVRPGPVVTRYELEPAPGTKTSRVIGLADDIARSMSALSVRVAVVPGSSVIGIELPNKKRDTVWLREVLASDIYQDTRAKLPLVLGKDIGGQPLVADLARMPHLLVAGTTGSGKSVSVNAMILSLLYRLSPEQCRFIMVDPKMLELSVYDGIPHLLSPVVTDPRKAVVALKWAVREMEQRYQAMSRLGVRSIEGYNQRVDEAQRKGEVLTRKVQTGFDPDTGQPIYEEQPFDLTALPFIVVIVDEMADLMLVAGKDVEGAIQRLAQMARAAGIHLIMATQRPSVDVITGTIKANFPTRISFHVTSKIDSRTILGEMGAEQLLGQGDMLYMAHGGRITRVHGPLVTDEEVERVVNHLRDLGEPEYLESVTDESEVGGDILMPGGDGGGINGGGSGDELYDQAVALVLRERKASTSFVQRHLQIGYNRAARLIERMEQEGLVSKANHVGKREILVGGDG